VRHIAASILIWPAFFLGVIGWYVATAGLTRMVETAVCQRDLLARLEPADCVGALGWAEDVVFWGFGALIFAACFGLVPAVISRVK